MAEYDGSVRINTEIDSKNVTSQIKSLENRIAKTADKVASLRAKIPTEEYATLEAELSKLGAKYDQIAERQNKFLATGGQEKSSTYKRMEYDLDALDAKQDKVIAKMRQLESTGKAFTLGSGTQEYANLGQQLGYAESELAALTQKHVELREKQNSTASGYAKIGNIAKNVFKSIGGLLKNTVSEFSSFGKTVKNLAQKIFPSLNNSVKKSNGIFSSGFKGILKYGFGIRSIYILINKFRTAIKEGFENLAQYSDETNASISSVMSALTQLKNSLATAFAPILNIAAPAITKLINLLSAATTKIAEFMSAISGKSSYTKAVKVNEDYAESLNNTASSAKKAANALYAFDELNVVQQDDGTSGSGTDVSEMFEEVPISGQFENIFDWFKGMWENADFTELGAIIGTKIKNALDSINWETIKTAAQNIGASIATLINGFVGIQGFGESIGKTIGEAINTGIAGINAFLDNTNWGSIGTFIGEGLNGLVDSIDWKGIGHLFAQKWNAIFETIGEAAKTFDWLSFGLKLADGLNTFITDFDWAGNGEKLGDLAKGLLDSIISFLENTNWQELGNGIADFIGSIDWTGIISRLSEGIGAALGGLSAFIRGLIEDAWNSVVEWWKETAFEDGKFTFEGLLNGILEVINSIGSWIYENVFRPIVEGFENAFGIHSPSTVMAELGTYIIQGLINGIASLVDKVKEIWSTMKENTLIIWNNVKTSISTTINNLKAIISTALTKIKTTWNNIWTGIKTSTENILSGIWNTIKNIVNGILGTIESMANGVVDGINKVIEALNGMSFDIPDWVPDYGGKKFGLNIPSLEHISIPRLATGAVLPANKPFMAVVGDQKHGTNVEAPLDTIKQAVRDVLQDYDFGNQGGDVYISAEGDLDALVRLLKFRIDKENKRVGKNFEKVLTA